MRLYLPFWICRRFFPFLLVVLAAFSGGCALFARLPVPAPVYSGTPVPAEVFDASALAVFRKLTPQPPSATAVVVHDDGRVEPDGPILAGDYRPESYGGEIASRLDLGSFPSLIVVPQDGRTFTHARFPWSARLTEKTGCELTSSYSDVTYRVAATFDYTGDGIRDWLVVASQQVRRDEELLLTLWLVVENPGPEGPLAARLVSMEERRGIGLVGAYSGEAAARERIAYLRAAFKYPPLPE